MEESIVAKDGSIATVEESMDSVKVDNAALHDMFEPRSVAVVGASTDEKKLGYMIFRNLVTNGFKGEMYPINHKATEILGCKAYPTLKAVPGPIDLAVICVPNVTVPATMEEAGEKGIKEIIIITAGFKELGPKGAQLELKVGEIAKKYGMRVLGPNCMGIFNAHNNMNVTFTNIRPAPGSVGISSQSGAVCCSMLDWSTRSKVGFSKFISVGNKMDVDEADLVTYLRDDKDTKVIGMYIEGTNRGREFMRAARDASKTKPILVLKSGRTCSGARAASSHTGALSGSDKVYDAAFSQAGIIRAQTLDEFYDYLQVFANMPLPKGEGLAIITNAGGHGVMAADAVSDYGLTLATFNKETTETLKGGLPEAANIHNPVDVLGDATTERYEFAIKTVMEDPNVHCIAVLLSPLDPVDINAVAHLVSSFAGKVPIPLVAAFVGGNKTTKGIDLLREANIPNYDSPDKAIRALSAMVRYKHMQEEAGDSNFISIKGDKTAVESVLQSVRKEGRTTLSESEGKEILKAYGVNVPAEKTAHNADEAVMAAELIGYPVVMKINSPDIAHKSDIGGVVVGVDSEDGVRKAFELIMTRVSARAPHAQLNGVTVGKMVKGKEVIVGMVRDEQFGPVITFGLGGVFVEIMKDVSQRIAPLTQQNVDTLVKSIKSYPILTGARGGKASDIASLKDAILRIAQIALDFPEISELEVNPVMVGEEGHGCYAVDALVTVRRSAP